MLTTLSTNLYPREEKRISHIVSTVFKADTFGYKTISRLQLSAVRVYTVSITDNIEQSFGDHAVLSTRGSLAHSCRRHVSGYAQWLSHMQADVKTCRVDENRHVSYVRADTKRPMRNAVYINTTTAMNVRQLTPRSPNKSFFTLS